MTETPEQTIARLTAGADPTPVEPGSWPTPGQYIHRWNTMTEAERIEQAERVIEFERGLHDHLIYPQRWVLGSQSDPEMAEALRQFLGKSDA